MAMPNEFDDSDWQYLRRTTASRDGDGPTARVVDLFAGCGGMSLGATEGLRAAGRVPEVVLAMELSSAIRSIYDANFRSKVAVDRTDVFDRFNGQVAARLTTVERSTQKTAGQIQLLVGGPPCQGHSDLNNHTRRRDPKNALYLRMVRATEVLEPDVVIIENVPGVRHADEGVVELARDRLERLGYSVEELIVSVASLGVPQLRSRHVLVATEHKVPGSIDAQLHTRHVANVRTLRWAIEDLAEARSETLFDTAAKLSPKNLTRAKFLQRSGKYDLPNHLRPPCHRDKPDHRYKSMYGRMRWDEPAQTITTGFGSPGQGRYLHPAALRTLTPHEAARLQFFPDFFNFGAVSKRGVLAEAIGNAVPPKLAFAIVHSVFAPDTDVTSRRETRADRQRSEQLGLFESQSSR